MRLLPWLAASCLVAASCGSESPREGPDVEHAADIVVLDSAQVRSAGLTYVTVQALAPDTLRLTGSVTFDPARLSHVGPRLQGRIIRVVVETGSTVSAGDTLAVLDSPELGAAQASWFATSVEREVARQNSERAERLFRDGIVSERRRLEAEGEYRQAQGRLAAAERALAALGAEPDSTASSIFVLRAPFRGVVSDKHATIGEVVGPDARLFTVGDPSRLWIILDLYESDLPRVVVDAPVFLTTEAYPGRRFTAHVAYVGATVDTMSRTVKIRVEIPNLDGALKPGMFARADLVLVDGGEPIGVPQQAIQSVEGRTVVFVPSGEGRFRITPVVTGSPRAGGWVEVREGLTEGDTVVAAGSFALKADLEKESFGEEGH